ncbi:uncharacterized protein isoform X2 [Rhodnius prolixus]
MNQQCKVCGEPAAGFHFGAFTCEGCKSFFGRSYNNLSSISECKNNGECVINKKNRTSCKACRLRKCLLVGMSKSGSRYGRRSNWFKIHCLLQEQKQKNEESRLGSQIATLNRNKDELLLLGLDDYKTVSSPSISPHGSDSSDDKYNVHRHAATMAAAAAAAAAAQLQHQQQQHHHHHHHHQHQQNHHQQQQQQQHSTPPLYNLLPPLLVPHHYPLPYHPAFLPPSPSPNAFHHLYPHHLNLGLSSLHDSPLDLSTKSQADTASSSASCSEDEDDEEQEISVDCLPDQPPITRTPLDLTTKVV